MNRKPDRNKLRQDANEIAFRTVQAAVGDAEKPQPPGTGEKNPEAVKRGRKGGKKGGRARRNVLTPEQRKEAARLAADARWDRRS